MILDGKQMVRCGHSRMTVAAEHTPYRFVGRLKHRTTDARSKLRDRQGLSEQIAVSLAS